MNINTVPLNETSEHLDNILEERNPLTSTVRIEQMIRMLKKPTVDLVEFVLEKLGAAIKSDLWWLSDDEQAKLLSELIPVIESGISNNRSNNRLQDDLLKVKEIV